MFNQTNPDYTPSRDLTLSRWAALLSIGASILTLGWLAILLYKHFKSK